jgi:hypothetical protein
MLEQLYHAVFDDGGLKSEVTSIKCALVGTMNGKQGLISRLNEHIEEHERERRRMIMILTAVASGVGGLVSWFVDYFFHR